MSIVEAAGRVVQHRTQVDGRSLNYTYKSTAGVLIAQQRGCLLGLCRA